jgi:ABC-type Fe3+-hydroxamate transport system substrate-binding protein
LWFVRRVLFTLLAGLVLLSACSSSPSSSSPADPSITFAAAGRTVVAAPIQYCDVHEENCKANGKAPVSLTVASGQPVTVSAPKQIAQTPWQVAARFADTSGSQYVACSPLFAAGHQSVYTVRAAHQADRLVLIEVYQSSAVLVQEPNGDIDTPIRGTWVLTESTQGGGAKPVLPKPGDNLCSQ